jgi:KaiC/GvpD/RAD55 family RecA-like ATPase
MFPDEVEDADAWEFEPSELSGEPPADHHSAPAEEAQADEVALDEGPIEVRCLDGIEPLNPEWLWQDRIPKASVTVIEGHPGVGKSSVIMDLVARMSTGAYWPEETEAHDRPPMTVLWITMEDSVESTLLPRLLAAEGDPKMVWVAEELPILGGVQIGSPDLARNVKRFLDLIDRVGPDILILDPGSACLEDGNSEPIARQVLGKLYTLGAKQDVTTIWIRHMAKASGDRSPLMAGIGSIGVAAAARSVLQLIPDEEKQEGNEAFSLNLCHVKSNLSEKQPTLTCELRRTAVPGYEEIWSSRVEWGGESPMSARALNQKNSSTNKPRVGADRVISGLEQWFQKQGTATSSEIVAQINMLAGTRHKDLAHAKRIWDAFIAKYEVKKQGTGPRTVYTYSEI